MCAWFVLITCTTNLIDSLFGVSSLLFPVHRNTEVTVVPWRTWRCSLDPDCQCSLSPEVRTLSFICLSTHIWCNADTECWNELCVFFPFIHAIRVVFIAILATFSYIVRRRIWFHSVNGEDWIQLITAAAFTFCFCVCVVWNFWLLVVYNVHQWTAWLREKVRTYGSGGMFWGRDRRLLITQSYNSMMQCNVTKWLPVRTGFIRDGIRPVCTTYALTRYLYTRGTYAIAVCSIRMCSIVHFCWVYTFSCDVYSNSSELRQDTHIVTFFLGSVSSQRSMYGFQTVRTSANLIACNIVSTSNINFVADLCSN